MQPQVSFKQAFCSSCSITIFFFFVVVFFLLFFLPPASSFVSILVAILTSVFVLCLFAFVVVVFNCASSAHSAVFASF